MPENLNSTILASAFLAGGTDYQQLATAASQGRMSEVIESFNMPNAGKLFQDVTGLFTTIGINRIKSQRFENPLSFLEGSFMSYGANVREIAVKWARAHSYDSAAQTLLKRKLPRMVEAFHQLDRADRYDTSISRTEFIQSLQPGIGGEDGNGLDTLLGAIFDSVYSPEAYDSMRYTMQVIAEADRAWNGLHRVQAPAVQSKADGEAFMSLLESLVLRWRFPSTIYNAIDGLPVFTDPEDIVIFVQPETLAHLDQVLLANLFAGQRAEDIRRRIVVVPDFPIPNVRAIVADRNFFVIHRSFFSLESFYNPQQVVTNYYLQSQGVWSASPLANIALLGNFDSSVIPTITVAPATLTLTPQRETVEMGGKVGIRAAINATITASPEGTDTGAIEQEPDGVVWSVSAPKGVTLNRNTRIDRFGILSVQKTGIPANTKLTISAKSTYINPSGATTDITATTTVTVVAPETEHDNMPDNQLAYTDIRDAKLADAAIGGTDTTEGGDE